MMLVPPALDSSPPLSVVYLTETLLNIVNTHKVLVPRNRDKSIETNNGEFSLLSAQNDSNFIAVATARGSPTSVHLPVMERDQFGEIDDFLKVSSLWIIQFTGSKRASSILQRDKRV